MKTASEAEAEAVAGSGSAAHTYLDLLSASRALKHADHALADALPLSRPTASWCCVRGGSWDYIYFSYAAAVRADSCSHSSGHAGKPLLRARAKK